MTDKVYVVKITRETLVEVTNVADWKEAKATVQQMYESGDACASLEPATFSVVQIKDSGDDDDID